MSPSVFMAKKDSKSDKLIQKNKKTKEAMIKYQEFIKKNFDYVGENFSEKARSIHYNDNKKEKRIYGTASKKDLEELREEGIETQMIPWIEDKNN